jgi:hypothetical protein
VRLVAESMRDAPMWGRVAKVARTPDPMRWWAAIDTRTYSVEVTMDNPPDKLRAGMSVEATIFLDRIEDVLAVPIQTVSNLRGEKVAYVLREGKPFAMPVEVGQANDEFIQITDGLQERDQVLLYKPDTFDESLVAAKAAARAAEATEVAVARADPEEAEADEAKATSPDAAPDWLAEVPERMRERVLKRWRNATPEERRRMKERVRSGATERPGNQGERDRPEGTP